MAAANNFVVPAESGIAAIQYASASNYRNMDVMGTPKALSQAQPSLKGPLSSTSDTNSLNFSGIGSSIILRKTEYYQHVVSSKKLFSKAAGLGPANVGSEEWVRAREKQERVQHYNQQRQRNLFHAI